MLYLGHGKPCPYEMVRLGKMVQTLRTTNGRPYEMVFFEKIDLNTNRKRSLRYK
jgi:hypothetical protein